MREKDGRQIPWVVAVGPRRASARARRRYPGAEVTLYNNSFGFMSWVVYILCVPRDNHETADDSDSYFYCPRPSLTKSLSFVIYDRRRFTFGARAHNITSLHLRRSHRDLASLEDLFTLLL